MDQDTQLSEVLYRDSQSSELEPLSLGSWFWVRETEGEWLGCIVDIGSNYAMLEGIHDSCRVHFDEFDQKCRPEPNWRQIIAENISRQRTIVSQRLEDVRQLTRALGVGQRSAIAGPQADTSHALSVVHEQQDKVIKYKNDLVVAKEHTLPELHKAIKAATSEMSAWLTAETLPLAAVAGEAKEALERVGDRIFTVGLYAGSTEEIVKIKDGKPADIGERLRVMQRRCYMDEECLAGYTTGGIECKNIRAFDKWLAKRDNFERIFPFPRTIVAFRVRRNVKEREWDGTLEGAFIRFSLENADKQTFLYIRNGQQLHRLDTAIDFGTKLFPDRDELDLSGKMWARTFAGRIDIDHLISDNAYQALVIEEKENERLREEWMQEHADEDGAWMHCPFSHSFYTTKNYEPFDQSSVYFDDIAKEMTGRVNSYNRIAVIIQGLYDRSLVLHPHPPVLLWKPDSFAAAVELIYDSLTIHAGEAPDFEVYRAKCNQSLRIGSITVGQEDFWLLKEAERENARRARDWRDTHRHYVTRYEPYGDPGPGFVASVADWRPKVRQAIYRWQRERRSRQWYHTHSESIPVSLTVPATSILNVSAYQPGDFRQFYTDYRTRTVYLKWANLLLGAEEYHAGNLKLSERSS